MSSLVTQFIIFEAQRSKILATGVALLSGYFVCTLLCSSAISSPSSLMSLASVLSAGLMPGAGSGTK